MKLLKYLCVFILLLCGCEAKPTNITKDRVQGIVAIEYDQLIEKIEADVDFLLYIGRSDCADCIEFQPILETYLENNKELGIYYLDVKAFRDAAYREDASQE